MFNLKTFLPNKKELKDNAAKLLQTNPELLDSFEKAYQEAVFNDEKTGFFDIGIRDIRKNKESETKQDNDDYLAELSNRIVDELLLSLNTDRLIEEKDNTSLVTMEEIKQLPENMRPQLTSTLICKDIQEIPSYEMLLFQYSNYVNATNPKNKMQYYHMFRQGLDILDLDSIVYQILGMNRNSIGYWFPTLKAAVDNQDFFKVPETKIIKVPLPILQLTRLEYGTLTPATLKIVNDFCMKAFNLDVHKTYFIKTGTYSSKFDFRNAKVIGEKEVRELGEYLLFIQNQAVIMAGPLTQPSIYGVSTTNEWCVREYIEDVENNPTIYQGLPLHTEYRIFVDFDTNEVIGYSPYWREDVMSHRFLNQSDSNSPHQIHDYIIYQAHKDVLEARYKSNINTVVENIKHLIPHMNLDGQWSIDIMQNGKDFYIIDMALAETSALKDVIPKDKLKKYEEKWMPKLKS